MGKIDKNRYYIRKKLRSSWHRIFNHETKFESSELSYKGIKLAFATNVNDVIFKSSTGEFLMRKLSKRWDKKTQYYDLYLLEKNAIRSVEEEISFGTAMSYIDLTNAKVYIRTSGGSPTKIKYSTKISEQDIVEWAESLLASSAAKKLLNDFLRKQIYQTLNSFDFENKSTWETFKSKIDKLLSCDELDIDAVMRPFFEDNYYYSRYTAKSELFRWRETLGTVRTKKKFWKACKDFVKKCS